MKDLPGVSCLVIKSTPRFPGGIPLMTIGYKYNSRKFLGFIATEVAGSNEPGDPYLFHFPEIYSNVSFCTVVHPHLLSSYFNAFNSIDNHNRMQQSYLNLEKYWLTQSGYFRFATIVSLGVGIIDGGLLFCHGISQDSEEKKNSTREYNNRTVYDLFNNTFTADFGSPDLNLPPITIHGRPRPNKISLYTPDLLLVAISVISENCVGTLTTPSDSERLFLLPSDDTNPNHAMKKD